ncbi:hypothetical protein trd_0481 [Thermomicrobium roseum DSM 5159]|uniref:Uncharacterized protein n=1 Tax=Thermomicrobium roseum (strain ATCC 27502 / DSM 5159 / P-2) TaxID=309801 RepID=B9KYD6_THERP|nr:hypothetical protein trd_0481 [Thermomicrobium roseum DSM 5159]
MFLPYVSVSDAVRSMRAGPVEAQAVTAVRSGSGHPTLALAQVCCME